MMDAKYLIFCIVYCVLCPRTTALYNRTFPDGFMFGTATASYQVEGAWNADGKGESIWDVFTHDHPEYITDASTGDVACNSYYAYETDVKMLKDLGVNFYRFSLSWARIMPNGLAINVNQKGIDYYNNLINALIENGITPMITIFHWDLPQYLQNIGGFTNERIVDYFEDYAKVAFEQFGDRVKYWSTFNEPDQICQAGYGGDGKAPALQSSAVGDYQCGFNLIRAHARAYHLYDEQFRATQQGKLGIVINSGFPLLQNTSAEYLEIQDRALQFGVGFYAHPIFHPDGDFPQVVIDRVAARSKKEGFIQSRLPKFTAEEVEYIKGTADYFGLNHYTASYIEVSPEPEVGELNAWNDHLTWGWTDSSWPESASSWLKVVPQGFRQILTFLKNEYNNPEIIVTENGFSDRGGLEDADRISYYKNYLSAMLEAIYIDQANVTGYTAWSLMDNFEWREGYTERFGLYSVDFTDDSRPRTAKNSAKYYKQVIATKCILEDGSCVSQ